MTAAAESACTVCGKAVDEANSAVCNSCGGRFDLNLRQDVQGPECGEVWIDEQYLSLQFACFTCLGRETAEGGEEPPVGRGH